MGERKNAYRILDNIIMDLTEIVGGCMDWIDLAHNRDQ
jgi:hypothetical protein